jgi:hypothetical protein
MIYVPSFIKINDLINLSIILNKVSRLKSNEESDYDND